MAVWWLRQRSRAATVRHKAWVAWYGARFCVALMWRVARHDVSKLRAPEVDVFAAEGANLRSLEYGSAEYEESLARLRPALEHHYAENRHHPEHWEHGIGDMAVLDIVEMLCDWAAAVRRHDDGDLGRSIVRNSRRFGYGGSMTAALLDTAAEIGAMRRDHVAYDVRHG